MPGSKPWDQKCESCLGTGGCTGSLGVSCLSQLGRGCGITGRLQGDSNSGEEFALYSPLISLLLVLYSTVAFSQIFTESSDIAFPFSSIFPLLLPHRHI